MPRDSSGYTLTEGSETPRWGAPDMTVLGTCRRTPPAFPLHLLGDFWARWTEHAAEAAACPSDYVALPLLASASALIGNARWAQATHGWCEPPHIWAGVVGDSGSSKSPGSDCLMRDVLPEIERRMQGDFPDRHRQWKAANELAKVGTEQWQKDVRDARKNGCAPPAPSAEATPAEPQAPRLCQQDVTVEKVATLLANAAPKGLLVVRDELAGWFLGMNSYNDAGREFWIEAYGGRFFRVDRQKYPEPINIPRLAVAVSGGTQPDKLAELFADADDGLLARMVWGWPEPLPFKLGQANPNAWLTIGALDRMRELELAPGGAGTAAGPIMVPLIEAARPMLERFGQDMQREQQEAAGLMRSACGKARGQALRLSLVIEHLWWCAAPPATPSPAEISGEAFGAACDLVADYFMPMAARVYGDAATPPAERNAATLARWIQRTKPDAVHVRHLQREVRLPGLRNAEAIHCAAGLLVDAAWLREPPRGTQGQRAKVAYAVNPALHEVSCDG